MAKLLQVKSQSVVRRMVALRIWAGVAVLLKRAGGRPGKGVEAVREVRLREETRFGAPVPTVLEAIVSR